MRVRIFFSRRGSVDTISESYGSRRPSPPWGAVDYTVPHEFGHTLPDRSGSASPVDDEYNAGHPFLGDTDSLMNIGHQVRSRHVQAVIDELNQMLSDLRFAIAP